MKKYSTFILLGSLLLCLLIGGVSAAWNYAEDISESQYASNSISISEWYFPEDLPGGGENAEEEFDAGISHAGVIQDIIDDITSGNDSVILDVIAGAIRSEQSGVGSSTKYNGVSLRDFAGSHGYENLGFFVYYGPNINDVSEIQRIEIYTYTLSDTTKRVGTYIEVYKTIAELVNGHWVLRGGWRGTAPIVVYGNSNTTGKYKNVIDPLKWSKSE